MNELLLECNYLFFNITIIIFLCKHIHCSESFYKTDIFQSFLKSSNAKIMSFLVKKLVKTARKNDVNSPRYLYKRKFN